MTDHAAEARRNLAVAEACDWDQVAEQHLSLPTLSLATAQVHATLALADEQRTANLIALFDVGGPDAQDGVAYAALRDAILARLGLTPTTPNQEQNR